MEENFNDIINSEKPTLVDFYATWCGPCKMLTPIIESVSKDLGDDARVLKVDVDKNRDAAAQYGIRSVPTLILFKEGEIVWRQGGIPPKQMIVEQVQSVI